MLAALILLGLALLIVSIEPVRQAGLAFLISVLYGFGIQRPEVVLLPVALIVAWVLIDIAALAIGFRVFDRRQAKRRALRARLLAEEGIRDPGSEL